MLTIFVPTRIEDCGDCPHSYSMTSWFDRSECYCRRQPDRTANRIPSRAGIPDWCPLRTDQDPIDFGDTDDEDVARLIVACDRRLARSP